MKWEPEQVDDDIDRASVPLASRFREQINVKPTLTKIQALSNMNSKARMPSVSREEFKAYALLITGNI